MPIRLTTYLAAAVSAMMLSGCNGLFGDIYDVPESDTASDFGFVSAPSSTSPGTIYINATDYTRWTYIDFSTMTIDTLGIDDPKPKHWDLAVHRYDAKTNGGTVAEEGSADRVADIWTTDRIVTDMSTMIDGYLSYAESGYNPLLSQWLDVDTSTMPPVYTLSGKTYILHTADGTDIALRLADFADASGVKGYLTIRYYYLSGNNL